jgi:23S rRNA (pseudouridine1915-N3)-methyltransferase
MEITLLKISKPALDVRPLVETYIKRMSAFTKIQSVEWKDEKGAILCERLSKYAKPGHAIILVDERGKEFDSIDFSKQLGKWMDDPGIKGLIFVIGGPFGFPEEIHKLAKQKITLSSFTLQGDLAWVVLAEQLYRAFTLLKNIEYHH